MGINCSSETDGNSQHADREVPDLDRNSSKHMTEALYNGQRPVHMSDYPYINPNMDRGQYNLASALDQVAAARSPVEGHPQDLVLNSPASPTVFRDVNDYARQRDSLVSRESVLAFDYLCRANASEVEVHANRVLQAVRKHDRENVYDKAPKRRGYGGQEHRRFEGDHFLYNADLIESTMLYRITQELPKGAHLHIHFNANLLPEVLINIAKKMDRMFITSDVPLVTVGEDEKSPGYYDRFHRCRLQFYTLGPNMEKPGNLFDPKYSERGTMRFKDFLKEFGEHYDKVTVDEWLRNKLVFHEEEAHGWLQTPEG